MFKIDSGFVGDFKTGDNINYNLMCLRALYKAQNSVTPAETSHFCKPIISTMAFIVEALLHDLFFRIQNHTKEGVQHIAEKVMKKVQSKTLDQLETYIASAKKHNLLSDDGTDLYDDLDELRKVRNRVHIQNIKKEPPRDEGDIFTFKRQKSTEELLEKILKHFSNKYKRPEDIQGFVKDFELPWAQHLKPDADIND